MSYQALYRAFRPTTLGGLVRQEHIVRILRNQIESGHIGHAYLFCGPRGTGKTSTAKIFARAVNCEHPREGSPCGECAACRALADPANLDIAEIDAASNNGVNEMRDLREKVQYPPVAGRYKVYIIDEVHMLSDSAFNALLKTLEEPPAHAVFILATTEPHKLPATILSRCMRFDFKLIPQADIEARLKEILGAVGKEYEDEAVSAIARAGAGSMRDSLSVADMCISYSCGKLTYADVNEVLGSADFYEVAALGEAVLSDDAGGALEKAEGVIASGKGVGVLAKDLLAFLNRCVVASTCRDGNAVLGLPDEMYAEVKRIAARADGRKLLRCCEIFAGLESALRYTSSPRIVLETALVKACLPASDIDALTLARRLDILEGKLSSGAFAPAQPRPSGAPAPAADREPPAPSPRAGQGHIGQGQTGQGRAEQPSLFEEVPSDEDAPPESFGAGYSAPPPPSLRREEPKEIDALAPENRDRAGAYFRRSLRRNVKSGVLFTMCQDLETSFEGDTFILATDSDTIYRRLNSEENYKNVQAALAAIGIRSFEIRRKGEKKDPLQEDIASLQKNFPDADIEIR